MKIYNGLIRWIGIFANFLGVLAIEKIIGGFFYWGMFPLIFSQYGVRKGAVGLFVFQFVSSAIFIIAYDAIGNDLFKIVAIKQGLLNLLAKIRRKFGWRQEIPWLRRFSWVIEFIFFSWQLLPPIALLCLRKVGNAKNHSRFYRLMQISLWDVAVLCASSIFATVFWTLFHTGLRLVIYDWFKGWI